jgi:hypothetical protein
MWRSRKHLLKRASARASGTCWWGGLVRNWPCSKRELARIRWAPAPAAPPSGLRAGPVPSRMRRALPGPWRPGAVTSLPWESISSTYLPAEAVESVHSVALTPGERRFEAWNDPGDVAWRTTVLFSAKESIFKCLNPLVKEFIEFTEMELLSVDPVAGHLRFTCLRQLSPWIDRGQPMDVRFTRVGDLVLTATGWPRPPSCQG